jgi:hypothetical protein
MLFSGSLNHKSIYVKIEKYCIKTSSLAYDFLRKSNLQMIQSRDLLSFKPIMNKTLSWIPSFLLSVQTNSE